MRLIRFVVLGVWLAAALSWAAEDEGKDTQAAREDAREDPREDPREDAGKEEARAEAASEPEPATSNTTSSSEPFVPSEEISEDLAVSFPVDI